MWEKQSHIWFPGYKNLIIEYLGVKLSLDLLPEVIAFIYEEDHPVVTSENVPIALPFCVLNICVLYLGESLNKEDTNSE